MCEVVIAAAQSLTHEDLALMSEDDMLGPSGLVVLPYPVIVRAVTSDLATTCKTMPRCGCRPTTTPTARSGRTPSWYSPPGPGRRVRRCRPLLLDAKRYLPLRQKATEDQLRSFEEFITGVRGLGDAARRTEADRGLEENRVIGEYAADSQVQGPRRRVHARFLYAFWQLCEQRITVSDHVEVIP